MDDLSDLSALLIGAPDLVQLGLWLGLAFSLGLVHAFDADHVMALSVFATDDPAEAAPDAPSDPVADGAADQATDRASGAAARERGARHGMRAGLRWSLGHGLVVLLAGLGLFVLGVSLPPAWTAVAERVVGVVMVGLGLSVFARLSRRQAHVHFHAHDGLRPHAHWHTHRDGPDFRHADSHGSERPGRAPRTCHDEDHRHAHTPSLVGALHGLAGSAPILALLPAAARSPGLGLAYLTLFGVGVAFAMAIVSGALGHLTARLAKRGTTRALTGIRAASGVGSIAIGVWLGWGG